MRYRPEIDGLRSVAVVPVVLFHAGVGLFSGGFVGVDVFFVISGYLITTIIIRERHEGRFSLLEFYERRARRILPALFFVLAVTTPFAWAWMAPDPFDDYLKSLAAASTFLSNVYFWQTTDYFATAAELRPLLHTWSLAVEEQYYLLFPLLLMGLGAFSRRKYIAIIGTLALLSLAFSEWGWRSYYPKNFFFTWFRVWELFVGSICAFISFQREPEGNDRFAAAGLIMVLAAVFFFDKTTPSPSIYILMPVLGTALLLLYARQGTATASLLSLRLPVAIGLISYSLYLWHQPVFALTRIRSLDEPSPIVLGCAVVATFGLAALTWRFVEQPFRTGPGRLYLPTRSGIFTFSLVGITAFSVLGLSGLLDARSKSHMPGYLLAASRDRDDYTHCLPSAANFSLETALEHCVVETPHDARVALVGDSHAHHYAAALRHGAETVGYDFTQLTVNSCLPFPGFKALGRDCTDYATAVLEWLDETQPDVIVLSHRWTTALEGTSFSNGEGGDEPGGFSSFAMDDLEAGTPEYQNELIGRVSDGLQLFPEASKVVLIYPSPEAGWHVPDRLMKEIALGLVDGDSPELDTSYARFLERNEAAFALLDTLIPHEALRFRPHEVICDTFVEDRCVNVWDGIVLYYDDDHLTKSGAMLLAPDLIGVVQAALPPRRLRSAGLRCDLCE